MAMDLNEIEKLIESWIEQNPDKIRFSLEKLAAKEEKDKIENNFNLLAQNSLDPFFGSPSADVIIYEFFDYNCGYCKSVLPTLLNIVKKDKNIIPKALKLDLIFNICFVDIIREAKIQN